MFKKTMTIEELAAKELQLARDLMAAEAQIEEALTAAGEALLDDDFPGADPVADVARVHAKVNAQRAALLACAKRRQGAIAAKRAAEAVSLREQAAGKRAEAERLRSRSTRLLADLSSLQGIVYGEFTSVFRQSNVTVQVPLPKSAKLQTEADDLERRADALERDALPVDGGVNLENVSSVDDLVSAVLCREGIVPSAMEILEWHTACEKRAGRPFRDAARTYRLAWRSGKIHDNSHVFVASFVDPNDNAYGLPSATFRAADDRRAEARFA